jgi:hypothetical protein
VYSGINIKVAFVDGKKYIGKYALKLRTVSAKSLLFYTHVENNKTYENRVVSVKHVFHSFLQILWETLFLFAVNILRIGLEYVVTYEFFAVRIQPKI